MKHVKQTVNVKPYAVEHKGCIGYYLKDWGISIWGPLTSLSDIADIIRDLERRFDYHDVQINYNGIDSFEKKLEQIQMELKKQFEWVGAEIYSSYRRLSKDEIDKLEDELKKIESKNQTSVLA